MHKEGFFTGVRNHRIYHQAWLPEATPRAVLVVVHGLAEHGGRYRNLVDHFLPRGYALYAADQIGHGRSEGARGRLRRFSDYTDTLAGFVELVRVWQKGRPLFLVGHSMGGLIGALYLASQPHGLHGAVLSAPAATPPDDVSPFVVRIGRLLSALAPGLGIVPLQSDAISRDPAVIRAYEEDPLVNRNRITARQGAEILGAMERLRELAPRIRLPLLILQGGADRLAPPAGARRLHESVGSADRRLIVYDGLFHEVFNEPERDCVLGDVEAWIEARLG